MVRTTGIPFSENFNINLTNISNSEIVDFIFNVNKKFPENPLMELFKIWTDKPKTCHHIYIYIYIYLRP